MLTTPRTKPLFQIKKPNTQCLRSHLDFRKWALYQKTLRWNQSKIIYACAAPSFERFLVVRSTCLSRRLRTYQCAPLLPNWSVDSKRKRHATRTSKLGESCNPLVPHGFAPARVHWPSFGKFGCEFDGAITSHPWAKDVGKKREGQTRDFVLARFALGYPKRWARRCLILGAVPMVITARRCTWRYGPPALPFQGCPCC